MEIGWELSEWEMGLEEMEGLKRVMERVSGEIFCVYRRMVVKVCSFGCVRIGFFC